VLNDKFYLKTRKKPGFFIETEIKTTIMGRNQVSGFYKKAEAPLEEISSYPLLYKVISYIKRHK
jgi:hypothetical protein